jgi:hypothetical protein
MLPPTGGGLIFDNPLILKVFGYLRKNENGYEEVAPEEPFLLRMNL